jgi:hypothetical protein
VEGAVKFLTDGAVWWAFCMVALNDTGLVVYHICAAEHDILIFSRGDTSILPKYYVRLS